MRRFVIPVFEGLVSGPDPVRSPQDTYAALALHELVTLQIGATREAGPADVDAEPVAITVALETSNDESLWLPKAGESVTLWLAPGETNGALLDASGPALAATRLSCTLSDPLKAVFLRVSACLRG